MTFKEIQDMAMADRFGETRRTDMKQWINYVGGLIWDADDWTFRTGTKTVQTDATGTITNLPADFGETKALFLSDGTRLTAMHDETDFYARYFGTAASVAANQPEAYTVIGGSLLVGPFAAVTGMLLIYQKDWTVLVADSDVPALPLETHVGLAMGASKWGLALKSDPSWLGLDSAIPEVMGTLRANYLTSVGDKRGRQAPAYRAYV